MGAIFLGLRRDVAEAARRNFDWGLELADALAKDGEWDVHFWADLIRAWSEMELDEDEYRKVLYWIGKTELHPKYSREIANALYALVKDGGPPYALNLLPQGNKIAEALWRCFERNEPISEQDNPAGILVLFWLWGFSLWRKEQEPKPTALSDEYRMTLSDILQDQHLPGRLGRTVLAGHLAFLLAADRVWTQENLLPLFEPDSDDFQAAWEGFLTRGSLNPAVADAMADLFLKAVERIDSDLSEQRDQFIKYYISMFTHFVEDPIDKWIPALFCYVSEEDKNFFAVEVGYRLKNLDETAQREWWQRWLKRYWENRLQGVPVDLEAGEVEHMLDWLPRLTSVFPEVVNLAVQMPSIPLQNYHVIHELETGDLWQSHPKEVAKLLVHWGKCDLREDVWFSGMELINKILPNISPKFKQQLEELKVKLPQT